MKLSVTFLLSCFHVIIKDVLRILQNTQIHTDVCGNTCMYILHFFLECTVNRVGVPSSVRDSQQPFLVLDGAVRMHRLAPTSFRSAGHAFFHQRMEG